MAVTDCHQKLDTALDVLFRDVKQLGFWDEDNKRIHGKLEHDRNWSWRISDDKSDRYGLFCLSTILLAKKMFGLDLSAYEVKIKDYLKYISARIRSYKKSDVTYGAFNSLILGHILGLIEAKEDIRYAISFTQQQIPRITDNQDSLLLIGLACYLQEIAPDDMQTKNYLKHLTQELLKSQTPQGFFETGDIRAFHHQRTMYTLWGLACASPLIFKDEIKQAMERSIEHVWNHRRTEKDDAFWWHPHFYLVKNRFGLPLPVALPHSARLFYECHQCFFAVAVKCYQHFYETTQYDELKKRALEWIFGANRLKQDLTELTGLGLPVRFMDARGRLCLAGEMFKGSYEIGSYICALADH